jgi:hypothetical protein
VRHKAENPFPKLCPSGNIIVNERCFCGCVRSDHLDTVAYGHGACTNCGGCQKYTFKSFVIVERAAVQGGVN